MTDNDGQDRGKRFEEIAMSVRNRDGGRCQRCGNSEGAERLSVHHLVPDSKAPEEFDSHLPVNLVSLCRSCHSEMEEKSLNGQLRKLEDEKEDLILSRRERDKLNERLENLGPDILNIKKVSKEESEEFLEQDFNLGGHQVDLSDFQ
jgi:5-methylcytosine-specific restriction endonuclease McrA